MTVRTHALAVIVALAVLAAVLAAKPAGAHDGCHTRKCKARVAYKHCDQRHPRQCVLHVIWQKRLTGWRRAWMLRVPFCESRWRPLAVSPWGHKGLYQFDPGTWAGTPYGRRPIWSAHWQAHAAAWMLGQGRAGEWACR